MEMEYRNHIADHANTGPLLRTASSEAIVNGIWFHLLSQYFPYPDYIIAPEYHATTSTGRACRFDLAVVDVHKEEVVFIYEGKKPSLTDGQVRELLDQTFKYIRGNKRAFAMYGTGDRVSFFGNMGSDHMWRLRSPDKLTDMDDNLTVFYEVGPTRSTSNISMFLHKIKERVDAE